MRLSADVFLSHAHDDAGFTGDLAASLVEARLRVWLDEARLTIGDTVSPALEAEVRASRHFLAIITREWLRSAWCARELAWFRESAAQDPSRRVLPVLRRRLQDPADQALLTRCFPDNPKMLSLQEVDEREPELWNARLWQLVCAVEGIAPGHPDHHAMRWGQRLQGLDRASPGRQALHAAVTTCGRAAQWNELTRQAAAGETQLWIVGGPVGEDHGTFQDRVARHLDSLLAPGTFALHQVDSWHGLPKTEADFRAAWALAFDCAPGELEAGILAAANGRTVVVLHPSEDVPLLHPDRLVRYYADWCAPLLARVTGASVKLLHAVRWRTSPAWKELAARALLSFGIGGAWARRTAHRHLVEAMLAELDSRAAQRIRVLPLPPLARLAQTEVAEWYQQWHLRLALAPRAPNAEALQEDAATFAEQVIVHPGQDSYTTYRRLQDRVLQPSGGPR